MNRREFLQTTGGALVIGFSLPLTWDAIAQQKPDPRMQMLDTWMEIGADGKVTVFTGKVELGTGVETALAQMVADELDVSFDRVKLVMGDTSRCPDQFATVGSLTIYRAGPQLRQAAAEARVALTEMAAVRVGGEAAKFTTDNGAVVAPDGKRIAYGELVGGKRFERNFTGKAALKTPAQMKVIGKSIRRVDLPGKVFGTYPYIQNHKVAGMVHGRVIRPPVHGAAPVLVDDSAVKKLPANAKTVVQGNFVAVIADTEEVAIRAANALKIEWGAAKLLPAPEELPRVLRNTYATDKVVLSAGDPAKAMAGAAKTFKAEYFVPYQLHASIGPSCAIADVKADSATLWSPTQSSFLTRGSVAAILKLPVDKVRVIWMEGSGCYGQNGSDDCTGDAALLSQLIGKPVRVQWMRRDETTYEPKGPAMVMEVRGGLDAQGNVAAWDYEVWSPNHAGRPFGGMGGNLLAGEEMGLGQRFIEAGADRNAKSTYAFADQRVLLHQLQSTPLRSSSLRGLGSPQNSFANESFIDELAAAAGQDPLDYRRRHLKDERAIAVLDEVAKMSGWDKRASPRGDRSSGIGRGVAFVQYDNYSSYVAMVVQVKVDRGSGQTRVERVWVAHDCGLIVNPDGVRNQIEGNVIQNISRTLYEEARFSRRGMESVDWVTYPIIRFADVPDEIAISLLNRPDKEALGVGEPAGSPVLAAIANAIFDATGARLRTIPFAPARVKAAMG
jgi:nicotinate dehydrogenase subunit B